MRLKSDIHKSNINKRGISRKIPCGIINLSFQIFNIFLKKKEDKFPVGPVLLGVFLFVVVGSGFFLNSKLIINYDY